MVLIISGLVIFALWLYVLFIRPLLLKKYPSFGEFAKWEARLYDRSRTILIARGYWIGGILVAAQQFAAAAGLDVTPIVNELAKAIPEGYRGLAIAAFLFITGIVFEWLRKVTRKPVGEEE
jgi:hypothetical protein